MRSKLHAAAAAAAVAAAAAAGWGLRGHRASLLPTDEFECVGTLCAAHYPWSLVLSHHDAGSGAAPQEGDYRSRWVQPAQLHRAGNIAALYRVPNCMNTTCSAPARHRLHLRWLSRHPFGQRDLRRAAGQQGACPLACHAVKPGLDRNPPAAAARRQARRAPRASSRAPASLGVCVWPRRSLRVHALQCPQDVR